MKTKMKKIKEKLDQLVEYLNTTYSKIKIKNGTKKHSIATDYGEYTFSNDSEVLCFVSGIIQKHLIQDLIKTALKDRRYQTLPKLVGRGYVVTLYYEGYSRINQEGNIKKEYIPTNDEAIATLYGVRSPWIVNQLGTTTRINNKAMMPMTLTNNLLELNMLIDSIVTAADRQYEDKTKPEIIDSVEDQYYYMEH